MPRRKKSPPSVSVESILWHDADGKFRQVLDTSPTLNHTVGFVVHEDSNQVVLAHEITVSEDWMELEMDYTKIPIVLIQRRTKLGEVSVQEEDLEANPVEKILTPKPSSNGKESP